MGGTIAAVSDVSDKMADDRGRVVLGSDISSVRQCARYAEERDKVQFVRQRSSKGFAAKS